MNKCEKCGFLECRCPDHVAQNYVSKSDLRKLVKDIRADQYESADVNIWYSDGCRHSADRIEKLLDGGE